jgi:hypothetical protein
MSRFKSVSALVLLLAGGLIAAPEARAQACIGIPAGPGRFALGGSVGFTDGATNYGAGLLANLEGPLSVGANYTLTKIDDVDENFNSFDGILAYELPLQGISACPAAGLGYGRIGSDVPELGIRATLTNVVVPVGLGLGYTFSGSGPLSLTLHAIPQFLYIRTTGEVSDGDLSIQETETASEFGTSLGFKVGLPQLFFGASVSLTTIDDSDPVFSVGLGVIFP